MDEEKLEMTEKDIQRIKQLDKEGKTIPLKICGCKGKKILISAYPEGAGYFGILAGIMCMNCGKKFNGFVYESSDGMFIKNKVLEMGGKL